MYKTYLKQRKQRVSPWVEVLNSRSEPREPVELFESSFLDDLKIDFTPREFGEIVWSEVSTPEIGWERQYAS